MKLIIEP